MYHFLQRLQPLIRKQWPANIVAPGRKVIPENERIEGGKILSIYGDAGWGNIVKHDKYHDGYFSDELVIASIELINTMEVDHKIECIVFVPSLKRPQLVPDFARQLAVKMGIPCIDAIEKIMDTEPQKSFENSYMQCKNAFNSFRVVEEVQDMNILLVDDLIDSGWTIAVCGAFLKQAGAKSVYAFALASSSKAGD